MPTIAERFKLSWDAFRGRDHPQPYTGNYVQMYAEPAHRMIPSYVSEKSIVSQVYSRIAVDVASCDIRHVIVDENGNYKEDVDSFLNECLNLQANIDQTSRDAMIELVYSMFDEGAIAAVPIDYDTNKYGEITDVRNYRIGKIIQWGSDRVQVEVYNELLGRKQYLYCYKKQVAIIQNPFYEVMNTPNSTAKRLAKKMALLDTADANTYSDKLNIIVQMPFSTRNEKRKSIAEDRTKELENQIKSSEYGIAYSDVSEKIIQLNRSVENNLYAQVKDLKQELFNQLGLTQSIFDGTADEQTTLNYFDRSIVPVLETICLEFKRKFLSRKQRNQNRESIKYFRNPFRIIPAEKLAEIADKLSRNAILSSNEIRALLGFKPVDDPRANELRNKNLNASDEEIKNPISVDDGGNNNKEEQSEDE